MIDAADARIRRDELVGELGDRFHKSHLPQTNGETKELSAWPITGASFPKMAELFA
jgi:hypothetical protein